MSMVKCVRMSTNTNTHMCYMRVKTMWAKHTGTDERQAGTITVIKRLDLDHRVSVGWQ